MTYTIRDRAGHIRGRGLSEESAHAIAQRISVGEGALSPTPCDVERVTFVGNTTREIVAHYEDGKS